MKTYNEYGMNTIEKFQKIEGLHYSKAIDKDLVRNAERQLNIQFSNEYVEILENYGCLMYNMKETLGVSSKGKYDVVMATREAREEDKNFPKEMYVISNPGYEGLLYLQSKEGKVYKYLPFTKPLEVSQSIYNWIISK